MRADGEHRGVGGFDTLARDGDHDVAHLEACRLGGTALGHLGHVGAVVGREIVRRGVLGVHRHHGKADVGVRDLLAVDDHLRDLDRVVAGDGESDARERLRVRGEQRADAHQLSLFVHERAARVAGVDGSIDLDEVGIEGVARLPVHELAAIEGAHDARRHGRVEAEGAADGHNPIAGRERRGVAHLDGREQGVIRLGADNGEVARGVGAHDVGVVGDALDRDRDGLGSVDHVVVGDDVALCVEDDARARARAVREGAGNRHDRGERLGGNRLGHRYVGIGCGDREGLPALLRDYRPIGCRVENAGEVETAHDGGRTEHTSDKSPEHRTAAADGLGAHRCRCGSGRARGRRIGLRGLIAVALVLTLICVIRIGRRHRGGCRGTCNLRTREGAPRFHGSRLLLLRRGRRRHQGGFCRLGLRGLDLGRLCLGGIRLLDGMIIAVLEHARHQIVVLVFHDPPPCNAHHAQSSVHDGMYPRYRAGSQEIARRRYLGTNSTNLGLF